MENGFQQSFNEVMSAINDVIWHDYVLYTVLAVGVLFTVWTRFCQYRALTHGVAVTRGKYDDKNDPGAINHFQALSAALSATVGLGNIGGVAVAIALGGPGAVFWMWVIGLVGMALKTTEVSLSMLYRNTDDPSNPHGGPMWVAAKGFAEKGLGPVGKVIGGIFVVTLLTSAITGGNMFQAWNVGVVTENATGIPRILVGVVLAIIVGAVIIGGIKRIGAVAGRLVPIMVTFYFLAAIYVIVLHIERIPEMFALIFSSAFSTLDAEGAFVGGAWGFAFAWGLKRALFSSEAGQGSSPIAHSAAKTSEPIREAVVAGLEPFIDTLVVCTLTALVILSSGAWNRGGETEFTELPAFAQTADGEWTLGTTVLPGRNAEALTTLGKDWQGGEDVFVVLEHGDVQKSTGDNRHRLMGRVVVGDGGVQVEWQSIAAAAPPQLVDGQIFGEYPSAALTTHAFDRVTPGLGTWLVFFASWLFAVSTLISWSYYGEQGIVFLLGSKAVLPYKIIYCLLAVVATTNLVRTDQELDALTSLGTGVMLWANIPIMLIFGATAMRAYHKYFKSLDAGEFHSHKPASITDVIEGKDVE